MEGSFKKSLGPLLRRTYDVHYGVLYGDFKMKPLQRSAVLFLDKNQLTFCPNKVAKQLY